MKRALDGLLVLQNLVGCSKCTIPIEPKSYDRNVSSEAFVQKRTFLDQSHSVLVAEANRDLEAMLADW